MSLAVETSSWPDEAAAVASSMSASPSRRLPVNTVAMPFRLIAMYSASVLPWRRPISIACPASSMPSSNRDAIRAPTAWNTASHACAADSGSSASSRSAWASQPPPTGPLRPRNAR